MSGYIDITDCDKLALIKKAYELSLPKGLGFLHIKDGPLSDEEVFACIRKDGSINMDYVNGRCIKFRSFVRDGRLLTNNHWYDHTQKDLERLMQSIGKKVICID